MSTVPPPAAGGALAVVARRGWLRLIAAGTALAALGAGLWRLRLARDVAPSMAEIEQRTIERIVDLLVPREETPGAVDLGIHRRVFDGMQRDAGLALAYGALVAAVDREARARHRVVFLDLGARQQHEVLLALASPALATPEGSAFLQLRQDTMRLYYAQPEVWPSLGLDGPPQPAGFVHYTDPPRRRS